MWIIVIFSITLNMLANAENCTLLKENFADATSEFFNCAVRFSRPITLCGDCVQLYINIIESYKNLSQFSDANGTHCIDKYINLDRLQIVATLYSNTNDLWNNAKCSECFEMENETLSSNKSNVALTFDKYYKKYQNCIHQKDVNDTNVCKMCLDDYLVLDGFYHGISNENEKIGVCMDMVDLMNSTRSFWSERCCKYRKHNEYIFIASTITVLILSFGFYVAAQFCSPKKTPTILQQRRFAESLINYSDE